MSRRFESPQIPPTLSRRAMLQASAFGFGSAAFSVLADEPPVPPLPEKVAEKEPWEISAVAFPDKEMLAAPYGSLTHPEKLPESTKSVKIFDIEGGKLQMNTHAHLEKSGWVTNFIEQAPEGVPGSGFFIPDRQGMIILVTNAHVPRDVSPLMRSMITSDNNADIAMMSGATVIRGDNEEIPISRIANPEMYNGNLAGTQVEFSGLGRTRNHVQGTAIPINAKHNAKGEDWMTMFAIKLDAEKVPDPKVLHGNSGDPVESKDGVVGIFHSYFPITINDNKLLLALFTGPDELRQMRGRTVKHWNTMKDREKKLAQLFPSAEES